MREAFIGAFIATLLARGLLALGRRAKRAARRRSYVRRFARCRRLLRGGAR